MICIRLIEIAILYACHGAITILMGGMARFESSPWMMVRQAVTIGYFRQESLYPGQ
jgi:hypothetical protein